MENTDRYHLNKNLGGVISFGSYFYLAVLFILIIISLINSNYFFVILFSSVALISFFFFFKKKLRYRDISFDKEHLYIGSSDEKVNLKDVVSISKGSIKYKLKNGKLKAVKFFYTPNNNYELLLKLTGAKA